MKKAIMFFFMFLTFEVASGQNDYQGGLVVLNNNDSIRGFILQQLWTKNPTNIYFKKSKEQVSPTVYSINEVQSFETLRGSYKRYEVSITTYPTDLSQITTTTSDSERTDTVFLKLLQMGKNASLFSYRDDVKIRFYILESDSQKPTELILKNVLVANQMKSIPIYKNQLADFARRKEIFTDELEKRISSMRYSEESIRKILALINGDESLFSKQNKIIGQIFIGTGILSSKLKYDGAIPFANNGIGKSYINPYLVIGRDFNLNPVTNRMIIRTEFMFALSKSSITATKDGSIPSQTVEYNHSFKQKIISLSPSFLYNVIKKERVKSYLGFGGQANLSFYSENLYTQKTTTSNDISIGILKEIDLKTIWISYSLDAGLILNDKIELRFRYLPYTIITNNYNSFSGRNNYYLLGVSYYFKN